MERRVLIVESQNDFALSMASVLKGAGYQTATASSAADAQRELQKRRPDLVVLRAELPDQSGFVLCAQIKKGRFGQGLPVVLLSSDVGQDGLAQHSQSTGAADAYLSIPFQMSDLAGVTAQIIPLAKAQTNGAQTGEHAAPPPMPPAPSGGPPKIPRRERRSAITEEDRAFLDRAFQSIADRKAELIAESHQLRRSTPRREQMGTPEGKVQILREELKFRESQLARISEIWAARERELLSVEDRLHEKDVEVQGLKMQVDDLLRRFNDAQQSILQKEREHGATVDELLLQKFASEKDLIEVVAGKEKELNNAKKDVQLREEELASRHQELEAMAAEKERLEKQLGVATLDFEVKEQALNQTLEERNATIRELGENLEKTRTELVNTLSERDRQLAKSEADFKELQQRLRNTEEQRDATVASLEERLRADEDKATQLQAELESVNLERARLEGELREQIGRLESELADAREQGEELRIEKEHIERSMSERLAEREAKIAALEQELESQVRRHEQNEQILNQEVQQKLEKIGELEGEVEASRAHLEEREQELQREISRVSDAKAKFEHDLTQRTTLSEQTISGLRDHISTLQAELSAREQNIARITAESVDARRSLDALRSQHQDVSTNLTSVSQALEEERAAHSKSRAEAAGEIASLRQASTESQQVAEDLAAELSAAKQDMGARLAEATQLGARLAQAEDLRAALEEKIEALTKETRRREEFLQNDLATRTIELADLQQKMSNLAQEKQRQTEALARDGASKAEQLKKWDAKFRTLEEEARKRLEDSARRAEALNKELTALRGEAADLRKKLQAAVEGRTQALSEREKLRESLNAQAKQHQAQLHQASQLSEKDKAEHQRLSEQLAEAEVRLSRASQEQQSRAAGFETRQKEWQSQLAIRAKKTQELEAAVENLMSAKARLEKEVNSKAAVTEVKAKELLAKLAVALKERKDLEARHAKELADQSSKHKLELERRDQMKSQEVLRLQHAVQEKSKALKVVELELARYKNKPAAAPTTGSAKAAAAPAADGSRPSAGPISRPNLKPAVPKPVAPAPKEIKPEKSPVFPPGDDQEDWTALVDKLDK